MTELPLPEAQIADALDRVLLAAIDDLGIAARGWSDDLYGTIDDSIESLRARRLAAWRRDG